MKNFVIAAFFVLSVTSTFIDTETASAYNGSNLGISLGLNEYQVKENVLNRIRHNGLLFSTGVYHETNTSETHRKTNFNFIVNTMKSRYEADNASFATNLFLTYNYLGKISDIRNDTSYYLGGTLGTDIHLTYFNNWDESHFFWMTSYFLGLDTIITHDLQGRGTFDVEMCIPIISLISRPPKRFLYKEGKADFGWFLDKIHENLKVTSLNRHAALYINTGYTFKYAKRFKNRIEWKFCYVNNRMNYSEPLHVLYHTVGLSFIF
ncbi:hypothetical protein ACFL55_01055 [Candidatus Latescibacterota bacterium]